MAIELPIVGEVVVSQELGYLLQLTFSGGYTIQIESDFVLEDAGRVFEVHLGAEEVELPVDLVNRTVNSATAGDDDGKLVLTFTGSVTLRVAASSYYEAWNITGPGGFRVVCMPDGELAIWDAED